MTAKDMTTHLFVYGTLREESAHPMAHRLRVGAKHIGRGSTPGRLFDFGLWPGAFFAPEPKYRVIRSVFALHAGRDLDKYEGVAPAEQFVRLGVVQREGQQVELDALVDTGASTLVIPQEVVDALGLPIFDHLPVRLADGKRYTWPVAGSLRLSILDRGMQCDAYVAPAGATALIGQIPLERLDLIVDPRSQEVRVKSPDGPNLYILRAA